MVMKMSRLLLCTDMDRTIIPNGLQTEHPEARQWFQKLCSLPVVKIVYVTGRHLSLVIEAILEYDLPEPDYIISDVGTKIYRLVQEKWQEVVLWQEQISTDWKGRTHAQLQQVLSTIPELILQEESKQSEFKLSYYLALNADHNKMLKAAEHQLAQLGVDASLIWSVDETSQIGLLDVLPRNATKLHGIEFLQHYLGYRSQEIIFAGDSGNDLPVLGSSYRSIVVANAELEIKQQAQQLAALNGYNESLYLAHKKDFSLGGNYSAGVIQGVIHFMPEVGKKLEIV